VGLITAAQVIFGELIPKRLALTASERIACSVAIPLYWLSRIARPNGQRPHGACTPACQHPDGRTACWNC
jgi:hypothetical protein